VRHRAWLQVPPRAASGVKSGRTPEPRLRALLRRQEAGQRVQALEPIPLLAGAYLLGWLDEAGWCQWGQGGATALTWQELAAWLRCSRRPASAWDLRTLHDLSGHYAAGANLARDPQCRAPWPERDPHDPEQRPDAQQVERFFDALAGPRRAQSKP